MPDYIDKTIAAYNQSPDKYLASTKDMTPQTEFKRFVDMIRAKGGKTVLDAGCAFGRDMAAFHAEGLEPTGIDLSDELLKEAVKLYPSLTFQKMDVRKLDFSDSSFDGIWCGAVLLHLKDEDLIEALKEFYRVLKTHGVLYVSFKKGEGTREVLETFSSDAARFYNFQTSESIKPLLQASGFKDIDAYYVNERESFGKNKRDLDWLHCFAVKD